MAKTVIEIDGGFDSFRSIARSNIQRGAHHRDLIWQTKGEAQGSLFEESGCERSTSLGSGQREVLSGSLFEHALTSDAHTSQSDLRQWTTASHGLEATPIEASKQLVYATQEYLDLARAVSHHASADKWDLLYRLLWRMNFESRTLLKIVTDDDVREAQLRQKAVHREIHKIHAFVRFRRVQDPEFGERYIAWMRTDHPCLELAAPFFARRFGNQAWSILTPIQSAHWDTKTLTFSEGVRTEPKHTDDLDVLWQSYYKSVFNPARVNLKAMRAEMPTRYWQALPEAKVIQDLVRESPDRLRKMASQSNQRAAPPQTKDLQLLKELARSCQACPLHADATQTVFGEGPLNARLVIVGEQPGDSEDREGRPFVGPAGEVLQRAIIKAGLSRESLYLTNAVKHFKWKPGPPGKPRLHQKPSGAEMHACKPWLEREIQAIQPDILVCLGQTAATALLGRFQKLSELHGHILSDLPWAKRVLVSYHPSAVLRALTSEESQKIEQQITETLASAALLLRSFRD